MRTRRSSAMCGLVSCLIAVAAPSVVAAQPEFLNDGRNLCVAGFDATPSAPFAAWSDSLVVDGFTARQYSSFVETTFFGTGQVTTPGGDQTGGDPESYSQASFDFEIAETTTVHVSGTLAAQGLSAKTWFRVTRPGNPVPEVIYEVTFGSFDETLDLEAGIYTISAMAAGFNFPSQAEWTAIVTIGDLPPPRLPATSSPLVVAAVLMVAWTALRMRGSRKGPSPAAMPTGWPS